MNIRQNFLRKKIVCEQCALFFFGNVIYNTVISGILYKIVCIYTCKMLTIQRECHTEHEHAVNH